MNQVEAVTNELLDWSEATSESNLTRIEALVRKTRKRLGEQMALQVIHPQEARQPVLGPGVRSVSRRCGTRGRWK